MGDTLFACKTSSSRILILRFRMSSSVLKGLMVSWTLRVTSTHSCRYLKQGAYWPSLSKGPGQREGERGSQEIWELEGDECFPYLCGRAEAARGARTMAAFVCRKLVCAFGFQVSSSRKQGPRVPSLQPSNMQHCDIFLKSLNSLA